MKRSANQLIDEIALREASLADAQRELVAGELTALQAATIEARETLALTRVREELDELNAHGGRSTSSRRRRRWLLVVGLLCFLVAIVVVLWHSLELRQAGNSVTGNVSLGTQQQVTRLLTEAQADIANGNVVTALSAYSQVLALSPKNVIALTQSGWLDFSAGSSDTDPALVALGIKDLRSAIAYAPHNTAARLYYAIVADSTPGNQALAKSQFKIFLALGPSKGQLAVAAPFLKQLHLSTS
jgi:cytochrome c-type biogenesis protein CcmH/NrfG